MPSIRRPLSLVAASLALGLLATPASAQTLQLNNPPAKGQESQPKMGDPATTVVAIVGGEKVYLAEVLAMIRTLPQQYQQAPIEMLYPMLLDRAVDGRLIANAGRKAGLADRADVQERIQQAVGQILAETYLAEAIRAQITDELLDERYKKFVAERFAGDEVKARHILLTTEDDAKAVIAELEKGADFAKLAGERSTGPSASTGGDLGWFGKEQMVPEFSEAAFALEPGTYTKAPIKTQFGWHVILTEEKRKAEAPSRDEVGRQLTAEITQELIQKMIGELREGATVERFNMDGSPITAAPAGKAPAKN